MKTNAYAFNQFLTLISAMKMSFKLLSVVLLCILAENSFAQGVLTHTTDADFNKGNLNNVYVTGNNVMLPYQANGFNINWTSTTSLPNKRSNHKVSFWNNKVYLTGGLEMKGMSGGHEVVAYSPSVYVSDVSTGLGAWSDVDSLPYGVSDHAALVMNGFLYVMGGKSNGLPTDSIFYTKFLANGSMEGWKTCTAVLPQPLWGFSAEFVNGYLVIAGGSNQTDEFTATDAVYTALVEPDGDIHSFVAQPSLPEARNQQTMVKYGTQLYLMGGYDGSATVKTTVY